MVLMAAVFFFFLLCARLLVAHMLHYCVYLCLSLTMGGCVGGKERGALHPSSWDFVVWARGERRTKSLQQLPENSCNCV